MTLIGKLSFVLIIDSLIPHISVRSLRIVPLVNRRNISIFCPSVRTVRLASGLKLSSARRAAA